MSFASQHNTAALYNASLAHEARANTRYALVADLEYRLIEVGKGIVTGRGKTINLSSAGLLFESETALMPGKRVELYVSWPVLLASEIGLKLCITGRTIRTEDNRTAVKFYRYEFRTAAARRGSR